MSYENELLDEIFEKLLTQLEEDDTLNRDQTSALINAWNQILKDSGYR